MKMLKLLGLQLKVNFGISALRWYLKNDPKRFLGSVGLAVLVIVSLAPIFYLYVQMMQSAYAIAAGLGQAGVVLASAVVLSSLLVLVFGLTYVISVFYFSRDLSLLVPLPLLPRDILGAKYFVVLILDLLTVAPFFLPALWVFGVNRGAGLLYWVSGILIFLLVPVVPLALSSIFVLCLMSLVNLSRKKDTLQLIGLFLFLGAILFLNTYLTGIPAGEEVDFLERILADEQGLVRYTARAYPPALFAARALSAGGWESLLNFLCFLGMSAAGVALLLLAGQKIFYRGLIGGSEVQQARALSREELAGKTAGTLSPAWAIALREIKYLVRTPIYLFNSLAMVAIVPIVLAIPLFTGGGLAPLLELLHTVPGAIQALGGAAFMGSMALFAPAASSSFSREGRLFWISQVIPVSPEQQIRGKVLYSLIIASFSVPVVALAAFLLSWSISGFLIAILSGMILSLPAITSSLLIDLLRPYLTWDNPQKAIKQNINVVFGMVVGGALYYLLYLAGRHAYLATGAALPLYLVVLGGAAVLSAVCYGILVKIAPARYRDIVI
jgi:ABC-2 type transport system permease protein